MGWTPLHLACYFGHAVVVEDLLKVYFYFPLCVRLEAVRVCSCFCDRRKEALQRGRGTSFSLSTCNIEISDCCNIKIGLV